MSTLSVYTISLDGSASVDSKSPSDGIQLGESADEADAYRCLTKLEICTMGKRNSLTRLGIDDLICNVEH